MSIRYSTTARNDDGGDGWSRVDGGIAVPVANPLGTPPRLADGEVPPANPEQFVALAWSTCLNATAQVIVGRQTRTAVRIDVALRDADPGPGYEFVVDAYLSVEGATPERAAAVLEQAHARCPVSKLLAGATTVSIHTEPFAS